MLLVIFGAGASYDSDSSRPPPPDGTFSVISDMESGSRPPLANDLFENRPGFKESLDLYSDCHPIVPCLRDMDGQRSIEQVLEELQLEAEEEPRYVDRLIQLAAVRLYLRSMLLKTSERWSGECGGITNYLALLDQIRRWAHRRVALVTFNYDPLLEHALQKLTGWPLDGLDRYPVPEPFAVFRFTDLRPGAAS